MDAVTALRSEVQAGFTRLADDIRAGRTEAVEAHSRLRTDFTDMLVNFTGRVLVLETATRQMQAARQHDLQRAEADSRERRQLLLKVVGLALTSAGLMTWAMEHFRGVFLR